MTSLGKLAGGADVEGLGLSAPGAVTGDVEMVDVADEGVPPATAPAAAAAAAAAGSNAGKSAGGKGKKKGGKGKR